MDIFPTDEAEVIRRHKMLSRLEQSGEDGRKLFALVRALYDKISAQQKDINKHKHERAEWKRERVELMNRAFESESMLAAHLENEKFH